MSKELVVEVRIKWDEFVGSDQLTVFGMFRDASENAIKRKVVDEVVKRAVEELETPEIDLSDLKDLIKQGIVDRKIDEVLDD